ncbi:MAG TPA: protocatechuate 3,4-dioxygenase subunit alpha [Terriglobales bacterium]|nr:protocatechuate 3,4-dioxygenase subunit alpha [Terriglobales bacterium]
MSSSENRLPATPSQTVGPYFSIGLQPLFRSDIASDNCSGHPITIEGRVLDSQGQPVPDAMLEIWQAGPEGRYSGFIPKATTGPCGFGRIATNDDGEFRFTTIKPGIVADPSGARHAPHLNITVFMRGLLRHLFTRLYFAGEPANEHDPVLQWVPAERRQTLMAAAANSETSALQWNIILQGKHETVFFEW